MTLNLPNELVSTVMVFMKVFICSLKGAWCLLPPQMPPSSSTDASVLLHLPADRDAAENSCGEERWEDDDNFISRSDPSFTHIAWLIFMWTSTHTFDRSGIHLMSLYPFVNISLIGTTTQNKCWGVFVMRCWRQFCLCWQCWGRNQGQEERIHYSPLTSTPTNHALQDRFQIYHGSLAFLNEGLCLVSLIMFLFSCMCVCV